MIDGWIKSFDGMGMEDRSDAVELLYALAQILMLIDGLDGSYLERWLLASLSNIFSFPPVLFLRSGGIYYGLYTTPLQRRT